MAEELSPEIKDCFEKGVAAFEKGNYDYALELLSQVLNLKPELTAPRKYLRMSLNKKNEAAGLNPVNKFIMKIVNTFILINGVISEGKGNILDSIKIYDSILVKDPNNIVALHKIAALFIKNNMLHSAIDTLEQVIEIDPENIKALAKLGALYVQTDNYQKAKLHYQKLIQLQPNHPEAVKGLKDLDALGTIKEGFGE